VTQLSYQGTKEKKVTGQGTGKGSFAPPGNVSLTSFSDSMVPVSHTSSTGTFFNLDDGYKGESFSLLGLGTSNGTSNGTSPSIEAKEDVSSNDKKKDENKVNSFSSVNLCQDYSDSFFDVE